MSLEADVGEIELVIPNEKVEITEDGKEEWDEWEGVWTRLDSDRRREVHRPPEWDKRGIGVGDRGLTVCW